MKTELLSKRKVSLVILVSLLFSITIVSILPDFVYAKRNEPENSDYDIVIQNSNITIQERKIGDSESLYDIDLSDISRIKQPSLEDKERFDCNWKGKEVENYVIKESYCEIFNEPPGNAEVNDNWIYYEILEIKKDVNTSDYKVLIDGTVVSENELKILIGAPIQAAKFIDRKFVVDFQTNEERIHCTERGDVCGDGTVISKGYYSSIWINGEDVITDTEYTEAFYPAEINGKLLYFLQKDSGVSLNYDGDPIELPYNSIPHYGCCEDSLYNIVYEDGIIDFFGRKDDGWYHVQVLSTVYTTVESERNKVVNSNDFLKVSMIDIVTLIVSLIAIVVSIVSWYKSRAIYDIQRYKIPKTMGNSMTEDEKEHIQALQDVLSTGKWAILDIYDDRDSKWKIFVIQKLKK
jgi:hypothetical protein